MAYRKTAYTRRKSAASRRALLEAALRLFVGRGFHQTSMQQVVAEAGTSIGNAYFYFSNKSALCDGLVSEVGDYRAKATDRLIADHPCDPGTLDFHMLSMTCLALARLGKSAGDRVLVGGLIDQGCGRQHRFLEAAAPAGNVRDRFDAHAVTGALRGVVRGCTGDLAGQSIEELAASLGRWRLSSLGHEDAAGALRKALARAEEQPHWASCLRRVPRTAAALPRLLDPLDG